MQQVLETAKIILNEFIELIVDDNLWKLFALLVVLHLLYYLWRMRKNRQSAGGEVSPEAQAKVKEIDAKKAEKAATKEKPAKKKARDDELDLVEVDLKPVIVYRKAADKPAPLPTPPVAPVEDLEESEPIQVPAAAALEPQREPAWPASEPEVVVSKPIEPPAWVKALEPRREMHEAKPEVKPEPMRQPVYQEPLPLLESDLANDLLRDFRDWGCRFEEVVYQGRYGADVVFSRGGQRIFVQIKEWKKKAGENVVQEVAGYRHSQRCEMAIIINYAGFERAAEKLAGSKGIFLWNKREMERQRKNPTLFC